MCVPHEHLLPYRCDRYFGIPQITYFAILVKAFSVLLYLFGKFSMHRWSRMTFVLIWDLLIKIYLGCSLDKVLQTSYICNGSEKKKKKSSEKKVTYGMSSARNHLASPESVVSLSSGFQYPNPPWENHLVFAVWEGGRRCSSCWITASPNCFSNFTLMVKV